MRFRIHEGSLLDISQELCKEFQELLKNMIHSDPSERTSAAKVLCLSLGENRRVSAAVEFGKVQESHTGKETERSSAGLVPQEMPRSPGGHWDPHRIKKHHMPAGRKECQIKFHWGSLPHKNSFHTNSPFSRQIDTSHVNLFFL